MNVMDAIIQRSRLSWRRLCHLCGLFYTKVLRWKERIVTGVPILQKTGPKSFGTADDVARFQPLLTGLRHCLRRSNGAGHIHDQLREQLSRRARQKLINDDRDACNNKRRAAYRCIDWAHANLAWAIDDTDVTNIVKDRPTSGRLYVNTVQDLCTRYKFDIGIKPFLNGPSVAKRLAALFKRYGAPLILKRDNGSNLDCREVNAVLAEHWVLPLNSPPHYPLFNGAVERGNREIKEAVHNEIINRITGQNPVRSIDLNLVAKVAVNELNHRRRRSLDGRIACEIYHQKKNRLNLSRTQRKRIFHDIAQRTQILAGNIGGGTAAVATAARITLVDWLSERRYITSRNLTEVLPDLTSQSVQ